MPFDRRLIEASLLKKGFVQSERNHRAFHLEVDGKFPGPWAKTSRGAHGSTLDDSLLRSLKTELRLETNAQVRDLLNCPMTRKTYLAILQAKGILSNI